MDLTSEERPGLVLRSRHTHSDSHQSNSHRDKWGLGEVMADRFVAPMVALSSLGSWKRYGFHVSATLQRSG